MVFAKCALEESFTTVVLRPVRVKRRNCLSWFTQTCVGRRERSRQEELSTSSPSLITHPLLLVYPQKTKDQVFDHFLEWKALVEKSSGKKLKTLRTDNGEEYTSKKFEAYLKSEGVCQEHTIPKTPKQNGVVERLNRTLFELSRSMLLDAKHPQKFWAEAVCTTIYLRNRCPTKAVKGMTPHEAWHSEKPKVDHLRGFAYAHIPKDEQDKFDSKARNVL